MNAERYEQVCAAFQRALELAAEEREAYMAGLALEDADLAAEVSSMMASDASLHEAFDDAKLDEGRRALEEMIDGSLPPPMPATPRESLGPYRVLEVLGQGGMGTVYLCEQSEPIRRRVAVKLIKLGMDSERIVQRFAHEREALERMEHPGIARLLDAGVSDEGRPWFAMEHVDGAQLVEFCDARALEIRERIAVLADALRALHHAHQRGILHRDLKPSNLLVTEVDGKPQPKIIDFGLARAVDREGDGSFATRTGELLGTPAYMSPEQCAGDGNDVDVRSDVFSMGVVLFELLTGRLPFEAESDSPAAVLLLRAQSGDHTPTLSSRAGIAGEESWDRARRRGTDPRGLRRLLSGELDWIAMRAMEFHRDRRYGSAAEFADDLEAFLEHRPVSAGPPELSYRVAKYARRHRVALIAATLVAASLVAGTVVSMISARDARAAESEMGRMLDDVQAQNDILYQMLTRPDPRYGGKDTKVVDLLAFGSDYALEKYGDRPAVLTTVMGSIGGNYRELGMYEEAEHHLRMALDYQLQADPANHARIAYKMNGLGILMRRTGRLEEAEELYRGAIEHHYLVEDNPQPQDVGAWEFNLGKVLSELGRDEEAREAFVQALRTHELLGERGYVGMGLLRLSLASLDLRIGRRDGVEEEYRQALEHLRQAPSPVPHLVVAAEIELGRFLSEEGRREEAESLLRSALDSGREIWGSKSPSIHGSLLTLARHHLRFGATESAEPLVREVVAIAEEHLPSDGTAFASIRELHGDYLSATGHREQARRELEAALAVMEEHLPLDDPRLVELREKLAALDGE